jgi:hypothetical protein
MGRYQALHTAVNGKSGAGQPIRHPASHLPGTGGRQPLHIAVNGKSGVGQPIRHPASLLPLCTPIDPAGILPVCIDPPVPDTEDAGCLVG